MPELPEGYPLKRVPRPEGGTVYDEYEGHPLSGVPLEVLQVAEKALDDAVMTNDVDPHQAEPIAHAVVSELRKAGYLNV